MTAFNSPENISKRKESRISSAINLFLKEKVSLAKAAELADMPTIEFKEILAERGLKRETEGKSVKDLDEKIKKLGMA